VSFGPIPGGSVLATRPGGRGASTAPEPIGEPGPEPSSAPAGNPAAAPQPPG
jgi:hypothetical protein